MYTTREIAEKLYRYARLVEAEKLKAESLAEIGSYDSEFNSLANRLESESREVYAMANLLHELKSRFE